MLFYPVIYRLAAESARGQALDATAMNPSAQYCTGRAPHATALHCTFMVQRIVSGRLCPAICCTAQSIARGVSYTTVQQRSSGSPTRPWEPGRGEPNGSAVAPIPQLRNDCGHTRRDSPCTRGRVVPALLRRRQRVRQAGVGESLVGQRQRSRHVHVFQEIGGAHGLCQLRVDLSNVRKRHHAVQVHIAQQEPDACRSAAAGSAVGRPRRCSTPLSRTARSVTPVSGTITALPRT